MIRSVYRFATIYNANTTSGLNNYLITLKLKLQWARKVNKYNNIYVFIY